jgi:arylsulfatase A-like enzyme/Tfp pilus assembly protein PilF
MEVGPEMTRNRLLLVGLLVALALAAASAIWTLSGGDRAVNVLLITMDTTRADRLGCYGYPHGLTPHINGLAAEGVCFDSAFCTVPLTLPSHATILTGLQPPEHGLRTNGRTRLDASIPTLATVLRENGYRTGAFIAAFALDSKFGLDNGFDTYDDDMAHAYSQKVKDPLGLYRPANVVVNSALQWLEANADAPFFCWVHLYDPHLPYNPHEALIGTPFYGQKTYDAEIAFMDLHIGRLLRFLQERDLRRRTLVVAVGDHGEGLWDHGERDHGYLLYDTTLRVPLICSQPGTVPQGHRTDAMVSLVDLFPTLLDFLGVSQPSARAGRSFKPALFGGQPTFQPLYAETDHPYATFQWSPLRAFLTAEWKYIRTSRPELYDRRQDPGEANNLAAARPETTSKLEAALASLESQMTPYSAEQVELTREETKVLESLGYVAGTDHPEDQIPANTTLPDIKDRLVVVDKDRERAQLMAEGQFEQAAELCQEIVALAPESARLRCSWGEALEKAGRLEEAAHAYSTAIDAEPTLARAYTSLGLVYLRLGRPEEALQAYRQGLALAPQDYGARNDMAAALIGLGRLDEAAEELQQILMYQPNHEDAHFNLGRVRVMQKDFAGAVPHFVQALRANPRRVEVLNALAWLLATVEGLGTTEVGSAVQLAQQACELTGYQEAAILDTLAAAYADIGDFTQAVSTAQEALRLASSRGQEQLAEAIRQRLDLYRSGQPYRQSP